MNGFARSAAASYLLLGYCPVSGAILTDVFVFTASAGVGTYLFTLHRRARARWRSS